MARDAADSDASALALRYGQAAQPLVLAVVPVEALVVEVAAVFVAGGIPN